MTLKIAFVGKMRSGKDSSAEYLSKRHKVKILKFADPLYEMCGMVQKYMGVPVEKDRKLLLDLGDWARDKDTDCFVNKFKQAASNVSNDVDILALTDARYLNELIAAKQMGFFMVLIVRSEQDRLSSGASHTTHKSELDMEKYKYYDALIVNDGSLEDLYTKIDILITNLQSAEPVNLYNI